MDKEANSCQNAPRRILVINPNCNPEVTARIQKSADRVLSNGSIALAVNTKNSPRSIETRQDRDRAEPEAIDLLSRNPGFDAYVMACFDDIAVKSARKLQKAPVIDTVEASIAFARLHSNRFVIVTTVDAMVPGILALVETLGAAEQCVVRAAGISVASAASADSRSFFLLDETIKMARQVDGAEAVILGSGGLTGKARGLSERHNLPIIDCIEAAVLMADAASRCYAY
jgi:allantoin racemase